MRTRPMIAAVLLVAAAAAGGVYWAQAPAMAMRSVAAAAAADDADQLAQHVDQAQLRAGFRAQIEGRVVPSSVLGSMIQQAAMMPAYDRAAARMASPTGLREALARAQPSGGQWEIERPTSARVVMSPAHQDGLPAQSRDRWVFDRRGLSWVLVEVRLPGTR